MRTLADKLTYLRAQSPQALDQLFQLRTVTEVAREGGEGLYLSGVQAEALYTSHHDLLEVMPWLHQQGARSWCDVGCGIGRTCLLWTWLYEDTQSFGVELVAERLEEARSASRAQQSQRHFWIEGDFASPGLVLPRADVYFLYLATGPQLDALLAKLKKLHGSAWVVVIESHGDLKPRLQWEAWWLAPTVQRFQLHSQRHDPWLQVYRTRPDHPVFALEENWEARQGLLPHELAIHPSPLGYLLGKSYQRHWELVVDEGGEKWTMETLGLTWHDPQTLQGSHPPRQLTWGRATVGLRHVPEEARYRQWSDWRRQGRELRVVTRAGEERRRVKIRKIVISPEVQLEFSDGLRVAWEDIFQLEALT